MTKSEKLFRYLVISLFLLPLLNCAQRHDDKEKYYLVSTNIQVPYWQAAGAGFMQAQQLPGRNNGGQSCGKPNAR